MTLRGLGEVPVGAVAEDSHEVLRGHTYQVLVVAGLEVDLDHRRKFDANDVAAGRDYVAAYVPYVHYVEGLWDAATGARGHHAEHATQHVH